MGGRALRLSCRSSMCASRPSTRASSVTSPAHVAIPLGALAAELHTLDKEAPTVTVCRSGGRSAQAVVILEKAGFTKAANLAGGMLSWHEQRLPVPRWAGVVAIVIGGGLLFYTGRRS